MERWNEINYILSERIPPGISEADFERNVVEALRIMGWSEFRGEVSIRPSYNIGASNRITPDIIVKNGDQNLFVIEIKQPSIPITDRMTEQLTSYLRFLKLEVGIIIGEKIRLIYDSRDNGNDETLVFEEISFGPNNPKGVEFVNLFSKNSFDPDAIKKAMLQKKQEVEDTRLAHHLKVRLLTPDFGDSVKELIRESLAGEFSSEVIGKALKDIEVNISGKSWQEEVSKNPDPIKRTVKRKVSASTNDGGMKIGEYVRTTFEEVMDKIDRNELERLQRQDYSKQTFGIQFPFLRKVLPSDTQKPIRYWKKPVNLFGERYFMCSEWYETPANNDRPYYEAWLKKMRNK